ncbi:hypothetical protein ACFLR4_00885 [Bacteroidota bacterium]
MKIYKYSLTARILYRYANIPATILLSIHLISSILLIPEEWYFILPALINGGVIYILNRFYFKIYRQFPFKISIDNEKMICSDFMLSDKKYEIQLSSIDDIRGGIFSGHMARPVYMHDSRQDVTLGFYHHINNYNQLITTVLSNVDKKLYNEILGRMKDIGDERKGKRNKKAR